MAALAATTANAASLSDLCTVSNVQSALPANGTLLGIELLPSTVTAGAVYNATAGGMMGASTSSATFNYCNVTVTYTHPGKDDKVVVWYGFPSPTDFKNRFYVGGGGGYSLSGSSVTGGLSYGAVTGTTDAGYDGYSNSYDEVVLLGNGSINWDGKFCRSLILHFLADMASSHVHVRLPGARRDDSGWKGPHQGLLRHR